MEEVSSKTQMAKIRNFEKGFMATHLINLGAKLGIFEALNEAKEGISVPDLATKSGLHEPYLKVWCQTAYHFEILDADNQGMFMLQPFLDEILGDKTHFKNYLANIALSVDFVGEWMKDAPDYFRTGKAMESYNTPEFSKAAYEPTKNIYLAFLFMIFPKNDDLKQMLEQGIRFLDIGCGNGNLITQLAQAFQNSTFAGANPDNFGIQEAKTKISQMGLEKRVVVENIGGEDLSYNDESDMVSMVVTLHEIPPRVRPTVVEKSYQALKSGGKFLILDVPYPSKLEDFRNPIYDMGVYDQYYEVIGGFTHLTTAEQTEMLTRICFKDIQRMSIGKGMFEFVTATK